MITGFDSQVFLAPMAGITDRPMRKIVASFGGGVMYSEMVAINAINRKNTKSLRIADVKAEPYPVVVQLVGNDEKLFIEAIKIAEELGAYSIDINMGCPVKKIVNNNSGSALMKDLKLAAKIIQTAKKTTKLMVSAKFRMGWDKNSINAIEFGKMCQDSGADFVTIHGRTRSDFYSGLANWDIIAELKQSLKIPVIGNGDIDTPQKAKAMLEHTKVDAVMIGRAALGAPWLIAQTHDYLNNNIESKNPTIAEIKNVLLTHLQELVNYYGEKMAIAIARKYVCWYCKNLYEARKFRERFIKIAQLDEAKEAIELYFGGLV